MKLHIGGTERKEGWTVMNLVHGPCVDLLGSLVDVDKIVGHQSCECIYISHVLEHLNQEERFQALRRCWYVLQPGGELYIGVPDLKALAEIIMDPATNIVGQRGVNNILFGGEGQPEIGQYNMHRYGYTQELLADDLRTAGFVAPCAVKSFGIFNDCTDYEYAGRRVSLNMIAHKPKGNPQ